MCRHCRRYAAQLRTIADATRSLLRDRSEDPETLDRLEHAILDEHPPPDD